MKEQRPGLELCPRDWVRDEETACWRLEGRTTCAQSLKPELQCVNIYAPLPYLTEGRVNRAASKGAYAAANAPIVLRNCVGGYSECVPEKLDGFGQECLREGMIYVTAGARGKQTRAESGRFIGKSPAGLVDLKSAVRYLKRNAAALPGDVRRIISTGVSAGGAMSALLGSTGNAPEYLDALRSIGAAMEVGDDVFAAQCYCPIIDLAHADAAYEWMFKGQTAYDGMQKGELDGFARALSARLSDIYVDYFNSLGLVHPETGEKLILGADGRSGSAYEYLMEALSDAATEHLRSLGDRAADYLAGKDRQSGGLNWLYWDGNRAHIDELDDLFDGYLTRMKPCTSFDALNYNNPETQEFGDAQADYMHFSPDVANALHALRQDFPEEYAKHYAAYAVALWDKNLARRRELIDPFAFIGADRPSSIAPHFRVRVGTRDPHTSFTMAMVLALKLKATRKTDVDYAMVWDRDHCAADVPGGFVNWVARITKE